MLDTAATTLLLLWLATPLAAPAPSASTLIVVEDRGGQSALPYYQALNLQPRADAPPPLAPLPLPRQRTHRFEEAEMLPVRSTRLTPGRVEARTVALPGLPAMFLIGDDPLSRRWLESNLTTLQDLNAWGLVVQVESAAALAELRQLSPGLRLLPASGDQLAEHLGLRHYPVLLTATGIAQ